MAVSLMLDRPALLAEIGRSDLVPRQTAPTPFDSWEQPHWETMYTQADPDRAREALDELAGRHPDAFGERIEITIADGEGGEPVARAIAGQLGEYGLDVVVRVVSATDLDRLIADNTIQATIAEWDVGRWAVAGYVPESGRVAAWAPAWIGAATQEGAPEIDSLVARALRTVERLRVSTYEREKERLALDLFWFYTNYVPVIGIAGMPVRATVWVRPGLSGWPPVAPTPTPLGPPLSVVMPLDVLAGAEGTD
jgi:ABC-type transport system substrate-binding protein